ncbi:uncharacterized protein TRIADDRAFT_52504 [Trichoplax adhaerens]|uniref:t-SNARE coiled-coil homology domain-containing protein n=1 Tax=Trichoplax adhaerens TaxID=10228 RepID=B3RIS0_TRIAD|nr:hypothetical protein TRIADDRAFT_52504 [Trichoplax adhaerens]EDV29770.1 hypothetical protein TRIADDRAFT_52504 [Trichoplax adhaerens]|eukprot:XP_002108972.1 hypothetical protein TRIADDRAFT_52504 [Trichoplax adhaerens]
MATTSLTEVFLRFRTANIREKKFFSDPREVEESKVALIGKDVEVGIRDGKAKSSLPPSWVDAVDEIHYDFTQIKQKMKELSSLHDKQLNRPDFNDNMEDEHSIEILTQEITEMFHRCQRSIKNIGSRNRSASSQEQKIAKNVMASLAVTLQEMSSTFRKGQSSYLKRLKSREEFLSSSIGGPIKNNVNSSPFDSDNIEPEVYDRGFTKDQLQYVEDNTALIEEREREIVAIVRSISELNEIFKDLSTLIVDQGTVLDRIDYNIEHAAVQVEEGLKQLEKLIFTPGIKVVVKYKHSVLIS